MIIEVCGPGCPRCHATDKNVLQAVKDAATELGEEIQVTEIHDIKEIAARGVVLTPAVIIDGVKMSEGRIPNPQEVKKWIGERNIKKVEQKELYDCAG